MNGKERKVLLLAGGLALLAFGHRLTDSELGQLGVPNLVRAAMVLTATNI